MLGIGNKGDVAGEKGIRLTLTFRASCLPLSPCTHRFLGHQHRGPASQAGAARTGAFLPQLHPALLFTEALSPPGGPDGELPPEGAADDAAAEERPAGQHLWPGESHSPAGAGGDFREGQRLAAQPPSAEEEQTAGEPRLGPQLSPPAGTACVLTPALPLATAWPWAYPLLHTTSEPSSRSSG